MARDKYTVLYFEQVLDPQYWQWAIDDPVQGAAFAAAIPKPGATVHELRTFGLHFGDLLVRRVEAVGEVTVAECHMTVHDKDLTPAGLTKPSHVHGTLKFAGGREGGMTIPDAAFALGLEQQYVEKPNRGGKSVEGRSQSLDNALAYLIHVKYANSWPFPYPYDAASAQAAAAKITPEGFIEGKWPYDPAQVATVRGEDYLTIYDKRLPDWLKGRAYVKSQAAKVELEWFREEVLQGRVTKPMIMLTDAYFDIYSRNQVVIDGALSAYGQRRAFRAAEKLRQGQFCTQVVYIHGYAGVGKTQFATRFIEEAIRRAADQGERWEVYRAAVGNPLDDWNGEEVLLLDDLRAAAMTATDWLLLLDPYNASPASARYRNKGNVAPRLIVLTASIEPVEYFFYARQRGDVDEALDQFMRRLGSIVQVIRQDDVRRYLVSRIGAVEPYRRAIETRTGKEAVTLSQGVTHSVEHSEAGASGALLLALAGAGRDVRFDAADDWPAVEATVSAEVVGPTSILERYEAEARALEASRRARGEQGHAWVNGPFENGTYQVEWECSV